MRRAVVAVLTMLPCGADVAGIAVLFGGIIAPGGSERASERTGRRGRIGGAPLACPGPLPLTNVSGHTEGFEGGGEGTERRRSRRDGRSGARSRSGAGWSLN